MALHIILGFDGNGPHAEVENLYTGRDAEKAAKARNEAKHPITKWVRNPSGHRRVNDDLARKIDKDAAKARAKIEKREAALQEKLTASPEKRLADELASTQKVLKQNAKALEASDQKIEKLEAELAALREVAQTDKPEETETGEPDQADPTDPTDQPQ